VNWTIVDLMRLHRMAGARMRHIIRRISATATGDAWSVISGADTRLRSGESQWTVLPGSETRACIACRM